MFFSAMLSLLLFLCPALATEPTAADQAEYYRLTQEIDSLSKRDAWSGVERAYNALSSTHVALTFDDHLKGAHAAAARGDMGAARERLLKANALHEDRTVIEWLFNIDANYGAVELLASDVALGVQQMPFDPAANRAIQFATSVLDASGAYIGLLPAGMYSVGAHQLVVEPNRTVKFEHADEGKKRRKGRSGS